jgi:hypothetical protein
MALREIVWIGLRTVAGLCSAVVTLYGLYGAYGLDFRRDILVSALYCLLPFLSFFVFLFARAPRTELWLHAFIACGFLAAYSILNWRSCNWLGDCTTVSATVFQTLSTKRALAAFGVFILSAFAFLIDARSRRRTS